MIEKSISRETLLASFEQLAGRFRQFLGDAQASEKVFDQKRQSMMNDLEVELQQAQEKLPQNSPFMPQINAFIDALKKTGNDWNAKINARDKGVNFRQEFGDSLLVFVSGKVKSGKSSLGNYVAWGHTDPTPEMKAAVANNLQPVYKSKAKSSIDEKDGGDAKNEAEQKKEFRVGATEATSSIQTFQIPGLTWVNSPGIHSLRPENEALAKEYLEHADLILYTMKSDSPGRESDLNEIRELVKSGKTTLLMLTGSDDIDEDEDEKGNIISKVVMKDHQRCAEQVSHVRSELRALPGIEQLPIMSISARYAQEHATEAMAFLQSGMGAFFDTLQGISQSQGVQIKQRVPLQNMLNFLQQSQRDLQPFEKMIDEFKQKIREIERKLEQIMPLHVQEGQRKIGDHVDIYFDFLENQREDKDFVCSKIREFEKRIKQDFEKIGHEQTEFVLKGLITDIKSGMTNAFQTSGLPAPEFSQETVEEKIAINASAGTRRRNSGVGSLSGAAAGFFTSGPIGAVVGAILGGAAGHAVGKDARVNYDTIEIVVGDNLFEIRKNLKQQSQELFRQQLHDVIEKLWRESRNSIDALLWKIETILGVFCQALDEEIKTTKGKMQ